MAGESASGASGASGPSGASVTAGANDEGLAKAIPEAQEPPLGMRRNNDRLQEILRLARGCVRSGRLPGEPRERDLFGRFEEAFAASAELEGVDAAPQPVEWVPTLPPAPTPEGLSPEDHAAKVRRDVHRLERATAERRQELDALNTDLAKEVIERCRVQDLLRVAKLEVQRSRRQALEAKEMVRRQEREIEELRNILAGAFATAAAAAGATGGASAAEKTDNLETIGVASCRGPRPSRKTLDGPMVPMVATANAPVPRQVVEPSVDEAPLAPSLNVAELRGALLPDRQPAPAEAPIWDHIQTENEKLVSVIDAVDELSRQLHASRALHGVEQSDPVVEGVAGASGVSQDGAPPPIAFFVPCHLRPPLRPKVYESVLARRPTSTRATRPYA